MTVFTDAERRYLEGQLLGRLATTSPAGAPQSRPLGFRLDQDDSLDLGGPWVAWTQRYRNVLANPRVAFVVDDMTPDGPEAVEPRNGTRSRNPRTRRTGTAGRPAREGAWDDRPRRHPNPS